MGKGSSGGEQIQRVIRELPEEAKPFLYGFGDQFLTQEEYDDLSPEEQADIDVIEEDGKTKYRNPDYIEGLLPTAQELFTGEMPEYQVADFQPMQDQAFALAQEGIGAYKPYLERGDKALGKGIQTVEDAINASKALADQISGEVDQGQSELRQAARDVQAAGDRGEAAGLRGEAAGQRGENLALDFARDVQAAGQRGESVAQRAARELRDVTAMARPFQEEGLASIRQGREFLGGATQGYDPMSAKGFYDPFTQQVLDATFADLDRARSDEALAMERNLETRALQQGAFSGDRRFDTVDAALGKIDDRYAREKARIASQLRSQAYQTAQQQAQQAFEQQQQRQMGVGQLFGQLGTQTGGIGTDIGQLSLQAARGAGEIGLSGTGQAMQGAQGAGQLALSGTGQAMQGTGQAMQGAGMAMQGAQGAGQLAGQAADLGLRGITTGLGAQQQISGMGQGLGSLGMQSAQMGGMAQQMNQSDVNLLSQLGAQQQQQEQAKMDATRANAMLPYQQVGFFSDVLQGAPIGTAQTTMSPGPSPFQQATGAALAYSGLQNSGVFS